MWDIIIYYMPLSLSVDDKRTKMVEKMPVFILPVYTDSSTSRFFIDLHGPGPLRKSLNEDSDMEVDTPIIVLTFDKL